MTNEELFETMDEAKGCLQPGLRIILTEGGIMAKLGEQYFSIENHSDLDAVQTLAQAVIPQPVQAW